MRPRAAECARTSAAGPAERRRSVTNAGCTRLTRSLRPWAAAARPGAPLGVRGKRGEPRRGCRGEWGWGGTGAGALPAGWALGGWACRLLEGAGECCKTMGEPALSAWGGHVPRSFPRLTPVAPARMPPPMHAPPPRATGPLSGLPPELPRCPKREEEGARCARRAWHLTLQEPQRRRAPAAAHPHHALLPAAVAASCVRSI